MSWYSIEERREMREINEAEDVAREMERERQLAEHIHDLEKLQQRLSERIQDVEESPITIGEMREAALDQIRQMAFEDEWATEENEPDKKMSDEDIYLERLGI